MINWVYVKKTIFQGEGDTLQPAMSSPGGPCLNSALQLGMGGPGLKSFGLPILTGVVCALATDTDNIITAPITIDSIINISRNAVCLERMCYSPMLDIL